MMPISLSRYELRQQIRAKRNALSDEMQQNAAHTLVKKVQSLPIIHQAQNIALYLTCDGEIDTQPLIQWLWQQNKRVLLPILHPFSKGQLLFLSYDKHTPMRKNQYGIFEPILNQMTICPLSDIDIIFTPLVAFDAQGQRLGMGGGYYDRSLAKWHQTGQGALPIGLAHQSQQVESLTTESWDIPLPIIITPDKIWRWKKNIKPL